jgi:hypothetical protein
VAAEELAEFIKAEAVLTTERLSRLPKNATLTGLHVH